MHVAMYMHAISTHSVWWNPLTMNLIINPAKKIYLFKASAPEHTYKCTCTCTLYNVYSTANTDTCAFAFLSLSTPNKLKILMNDIGNSIDFNPLCNLPINLSLTSLQVS